MGLAQSGGRPATAAALAGRSLQIGDERAVSRKELAAVARDAMKGLELRPSERLILGELVGCWGEKMVSDRILVYPSNEYLCRRTGLSERTVRYGTRRLVDRLLVTPKDSANGKRFAIKNRSGEIVDVYGFDLTPLYARRAEFVGLIYAQDAENEAKSRIFDEITICRRAVEETLAALARLSENCHGFLTSLESLVARTPRRTYRLAEAILSPVLGSWRALKTEVEEFFYRAASGGNLCSHIETKPSESINRHLKQEASDEAEFVEKPSPNFTPFSVAMVVEACPSLLEYIEKPESEVDLVAAGRFLRSSLGAHASVWEEAIAAIGPVEAAAAVCITLQRHEDAVRNKTAQIKNPGGYLRSMVRMIADRRMSVRSELIAMIRRRLN